MIRLLIIGIFSLLCLLPAYALEVPKLQSRVNDYANILSAQTEQRLEEQLHTLEKQDSTQIAVLTIKSLEGENLESFSLRVAEQWQLGQKDLDNGALLLIAKDDRKMRIEVGYGLEDQLTDLIAGRIIRNSIRPKFKRGDFNQGVIDGVRDMIAAVNGEYKPPARNYQRKARKPQRSTDPFTLIGFIVWAFLMIRGLICSLTGSCKSDSGDSNDRFGSGGFGGGFSSGGGGFSGGGGSFGGGGASGGW